MCFNLMRAKVGNELHAKDRYEKNLIDRQICALFGFLQSWEVHAQSMAAFDVFDELLIPINSYLTGVI